MKATLILSRKVVWPDGAITEIVIWHLPDPVPPATHRIKYRLVYVVDGIRLIGFDNERGKGDHRHLRGVETPYRFVSVRRMLDEFDALIATERSTG